MGCVVAGLRTLTRIEEVRVDMRDHLRQLELDAAQRLEDYAATVAETLAVALVPLFSRLESGVFFEHPSGATVAFSAGGYRVTWPLGTGSASMGEAHFPLGDSPCMVAGMARLLVHGWEEMAEHA